MNKIKSFFSDYSSILIVSCIVLVMSIPTIIGNVLSIAKSRNTNYLINNASFRIDDYDYDSYNIADISFSYDPYGFGYSETEIHPSIYVTVRFFDNYKYNKTQLSELSYLIYDDICVDWYSSGCKDRADKLKSKLFIDIEYETNNGYIDSYDNTY